MSKEYVKKISLQLNGKEIENSLKEVGKEIGVLRRKLREANTEEDRAKINAQLQEARSAYKDINDELREQKVTLTEIRSAGENIFNGLLSGDFDAVSNGFNTIKTGISGATKSALAFMATPMGLLLTFLAGTALGVKKWIDFNVEVAKTNKLVKDLTGLTGTAVDGVRIRAEVLRDTFEVDLKESIETAKSLAVNMGISYNQAFDVIEKGAVKGRLANDEYLDSLKEYAPQFKQAGYSVQEFEAIVGAGIDLSIYTDKLPDAIKEAGTELRDGSDGLREAITNAFGQNFSDDIIGRVQNGQTTVKDALEELNQKANEYHLNEKQRQDLTSKLFISAGEDAGGALKIFEALTLATENQKKPLTELQQLNQDNLNTQKELQGVYTSLFSTGDKGFATWIAKGKLWFNEFLLKAILKGVDFINFFIKLNNEVGGFYNYIKLLKLPFDTLKTITNSFFQNLITGFKGMKDMIVGLVTFDTDQMKSGWETYKQYWKDVGKDVVDQVKTDFNSIKDGFLNGEDAQLITIENYTTNENNDTPETNNTVNENGLTPEDQAKLDSKKNLQKFLDEWEEEKKLKEELKKFDEEQQEEEKEILELENLFAKKEEEGVLLEELEIAKEEKIQAIRDKWSQIRLEKNNAAFAKEADDRAKYHQDIINAEATLEQAKYEARQFGIQSLLSFAKQGSDIYKVLFLADKVNTANEVILRGVEERAKIRAAYALIPGGQLISEPLVQASKIRTAISLGTIAATTVQAFGSGKGLYHGGFSGNEAIGYDEYGKITNYTHDGEWTSPKWMVQNPRYASTIQWLEAERKKGANAYGSALPTNTNNNTQTPVNVEDIAVDIQTDDSVDLNSTLLKLYNLLNGNLFAKLILEYDDVEKINEVNEEITRSNNNGTLVK